MVVGLTDLGGDLVGLGIVKILFVVSTDVTFL